MPLRNTPTRYGSLSISLHWLAALAVFGLFGLGFWMVGLSYYDPLRQSAPYWHKSIGIVLLLLMAIRAVWRVISPPPAPLPSHGPLTRRASHLGHLALYLGVFVVMISGYLISTADGRPIEVFGLFTVPATVSGLPQQEDIAGAVHKYAAWALVLFAGVHALAALKHHVIDRDSTLLRMFGRG